MIALFYLDCISLGFIKVLRCRVLLYFYFDRWYKGGVERKHPLFFEVFIGTCLQYTVLVFLWEVGIGTSVTHLILFSSWFSYLLFRFAFAKALSPGFLSSSLYFALWIIYILVREAVWSLSSCVWFISPSMILITFFLIVLNEPASYRF